ncbi:MAG: TRAFs-binding domain-containing protein [Myxococcota bacterium]
MSSQPPPPMVFVAMPFGAKRPPGRDGPCIDFDRIFAFIEAGVAKVGLECHRGDLERPGGFIHRTMFESLLLAEYVVADLTLANPNVAYELGVRHGGGARATILLCARPFMEHLPFDLKPLRVHPYDLAADGGLDDEAGARLTGVVEEQLRAALAGKLPSDNPLLQVTSAHPDGGVQHEKIDIFLERMEYASQVGERVRAALDDPDQEHSRATLRALGDELLEAPGLVPQLHSALLSVFLGLREIEAHDEMVALYDRMPRELQRTPVAIEQLAFALNRLAEAAGKAGEGTRAQRLRNEAFRTLEALQPEQWTSETHGIAGRIHKGRAEAERAADRADEAEAAMQRAIETYEAGFRADPRDYYPGVNAVMLRQDRGSEEDDAALQLLLPAVRFAVDRAPTPRRVDERYWQAATRLELACAAGDWDAAEHHAARVASLKVPTWMRKTTTKTLRRRRKRLDDGTRGARVLDDAIRKLG